MTCKRITASIVSILTLISCDAIFPDKTEPTPTEIFDELWNGVDQKYVCFSNKDIDWDAVYLKYRGQISDDTDNDQLFSVLCQMLDELRDGHVSLYTESKKWSGYRVTAVYNKYPYLTSQYLGENYKESGGLRYNTIRDGAIGYVEYTSFNDDLSDEQVLEMLAFCKDCHGLILDLRENSGGKEMNGLTLLKYLPCEDELYSIHVRHNGIRNDLLQKGITHKPGCKDESKIWRKPLIVLIDGRSYSAATIFAMCVKGCENVTVVGVKTAGGTGFPLHYELSNGWLYRIPTIKSISRSGIDYEDGVPPDVEVSLDKDMYLERRDGIIETACEIIESQSDKRN